MTRQTSEQRALQDDMRQISHAVAALEMGNIPLFVNVWRTCLDHTDMLVDCFVHHIDCHVLLALPLNDKEMDELCTKYSIVVRNLGSKQQVLDFEVALATTHGGGGVDRE